MKKSKETKETEKERIIATVQKKYIAVIQQLAASEDRRINDVVNRLIASGLKERGIQTE